MSTEPVANASDREPTTETDASAGWRAEYAFAGVDTDIEPDDQSMSDPDSVAAATREDRSTDYRRKHARGVSS